MSDEEAGLLRQIIGAQEAVNEAGLLDLDLVMGIVAEQAWRLTCADGAIVELAEGDEMVSRAATGPATKQLGQRHALESSFSGRCVRSGEPQVCDDAETDPAIDAGRWLGAGIRSMAAVPLRHRGATIGVLQVHSHEPGAFRQADVDVLELLVGFAASTMAGASARAGDARDASHDRLTGLVNRSTLLERLDGAIQRRRGGDGVLAVLAVDLEDLSSVAPDLGDEGADAVLRVVADRLRDTLRASDVASRVGGEEFVVMVECGTAFEVCIVRQRIESIIEQPVEVDGRVVRVRASIGTATSLGRDEGAATLIARADSSLLARSREQGDRAA